MFNFILAVYATNIDNRFNKKYYNYNEKRNKNDI